MNGTSVHETAVFPVPTAVGSYIDNTGTHKSRHAEVPFVAVAEGMREARLLYRSCLAFDGCCGTSKTAAETGENEKMTWGVCMGLVGSSWSDSDPVINCQISRL